MLSAIGKYLLVLGICKLDLKGVRDILRQSDIELVDLDQELVKRVFVQRILKKLQLLLLDHRALHALVDFLSLLVQNLSVLPNPLFVFHNFLYYFPLPLLSQQVCPRSDFTLLFLFEPRSLLPQLDFQVSFLSDSLVVS